MTGDTLVDVRVHGNHSTPDTTILEIAGLAIGSSVTDAVINEATRRLNASNRFSSVEIRKRFSSIADPTRIMLIVLVEERPGVSTDNLTPGALRRIVSLAQWAPILDFEDGYGFTYGARLSRANVFGQASRVSIPMSWGGTRRVALDVERTFDRGPIDRLTATARISRRENPFYETGETRREAHLTIVRAITPTLRLRGGARAGRVSFGGLVDTATGLHAGAAIDTRLDPNAPRNAVFASLDWERLAFDRRAPAIRLSTDARAYIGLFGSSVLAVRAQASTADGPLPPYERALLGGTSSLRGQRPGIAVGDSLVGGSIELRVPLTSPRRAGRFGVKAFVDAATAWNAGEKFGEQRFLVGAGGGVYLGVRLFTVALDAGRSEGWTRLHFGLGMSF